MAYGGLKKERNAAAETRRNPVSKHQIQLKVENEQVDVEPVLRDQILRRERAQ